MLEYLKNIPEEKQGIVIECCYDKAFEIYNNVSELSNYWRLSSDVQEEPKDPSNMTDISWKDLVDILHLIETKHEEINDRPVTDAPDILDFIDPTISYNNEYSEYREAILTFIPNVRKDDVESKDNISLYVTLLDTVRKNDPDAFKAEGDSLVENNEKGTKFFLAAIGTVARSYNIRDVRRHANLCNEIKAISDGIPILSTQLHNLNYVAGIFEAILSSNRFQKKEQYIEKELNKLNRKIRHVANKPLPKKKTQEDIIERNHKDFFKIPPRTEEERGIMNVEFVRKTSKQFDSFEEAAYTKMNELTGIEYNLLFHIVEQKRQLKQSEKDIFSSITGEEYI